MTSERWGAFSVIDHKDTAALIPEILLYDRLVIPVPYDPPTYEGAPPLYDDRPRWEKEHWDSYGLEKRLNVYLSSLVQVKIAVLGLFSNGRNIRLLYLRKHRA